MLVRSRFTIIGIVASSTIDNLDIFPPVLTFDEVEVTGADTGNTTKNRLVSNFLATGWEDHKDIVHSSSTPAHSLDDVDETSTSLTFNKILNNYLAKGWEDHKDIQYPAGGTDVHGFEDIDENSQNVTYNKIMNNDLAHTWNMHTNSTYTTGGSGIHGLQSVNASGSEIVFNKLVNDFLATRWNDHALDNSSDVHNQYMPISGSRIFTYAVSGQTPTQDEHLVTKLYVDGYTGDNYAPLTGNFIFSNTVSGQNPTQAEHLSTRWYVDSTVSDYAPLTGDFLFSNTVSGQTPTQDEHLVTKLYADDNLAVNKVKYGMVDIPVDSLTITGSFDTSFSVNTCGNYTLLTSLEASGGSLKHYDQLITSKKFNKFVVLFSEEISSSDYILNYQATKI